MGEFSAWHWLIVAVVVLLLFGTNKLPQMARSLGQGIRIFRAETRSVTQSDDAATSRDNAPTRDRSRDSTTREQ